MELIALAKGQQGATLQQEMMNVEASRQGGKKTNTSDNLVQRIQIAHGKVKDILKSSALLTDAYFHYTPSQIWLSAFMQADEPLTHFYISSKLASNSAFKTKLLETLRACCNLLESSLPADPGDVEMRELMKIDKKLYRCRNPEKMDLVSIDKAQKRDGDGKDEDRVDEKTIKKRKVERQKSEMEADDMFGPALSRKNDG